MGASVVAAKVSVPASSALPRERLEGLLKTIWSHRLGVVVAQAGSGKTTLLAAFAAATEVPVAWYRADTWDADEAAMLKHLEVTLTAALVGLPGGWTGVSSAAAALDAWRGGRALLVIDDIHALEGTPAEQALGRFIEYAPSWLAVLVGSRVAPGFNLSRLRVAGQLLELGQDELRFRAWEVEQLFREHYGHPIPPDDLAVLARRTEGWAAGLQLFHLATRDKSAVERRRILSAAGSGSRLVREYLTWNVMVDLPEELRNFLVETCVLGRLTGGLCDRLLERGGSSTLLDELFRRGIFTVELDAIDGSYRYHEVLRSHLDRMLVERVGEEKARDRYRRAGALLEASGAAAEALGAFSRAEDWVAVRRLLGGQGERLADGGSEWLHDLPPAIIRHEPWLELAGARRARAEGRWNDAIGAYERAAGGFGPTRISNVCHDERQALRAWFDPVPQLAPAADWTRILRAGLARDPLRHTREMASVDAVPMSLVRGLLALAAGDVTSARRELNAAVAALDDHSVFAIAAAIGLGAARLLGGDRGGIADLDRAEDLAERSAFSWLARLARSAGRLGAVAAAPIRPGRDAVGARADDPWGTAFVALFEAWNPGVAKPDGSDAPESAQRRAAAGARAAAVFHDLDAAVLESWASALGALGLAEGHADGAHESGVAADALARSAGVPGARLIANRALERSDPARGAVHRELAGSLRAETGVIDPPASVRTHELPEPTTDEVCIRLFGGFEMSRQGRSIALDGIRPRARSLLRLLAARAGALVHREVITAALWPEADPNAASRSLQVAVSAVRGLLVAEFGPGAGRLLARQGDAYRLDVGPDSVDIRRFDRHMAEARSAGSRGESPLPSITKALELYEGDLLPEEGPEEWIVDLRGEYRTQAVEASQSAAEAALSDGDTRTAIELCRSGLAIDRYHDPLWRLLVEARRREGDVGAADRDRRDYEAMLTELGLPPESAVSVS